MGGCHAAFCGVAPRQCFGIGANVLHVSEHAQLDPTSFEAALCCAMKQYAEALQAAQEAGRYSIARDETKHIAHLAFAGGNLDPRRYWRSKRAGHLHH